MSSRGARIHAVLLGSVCSVACELLGARAASVALLDERAGELEFVSAAGDGADAIAGARFKATEGLSTRDPNCSKSSCWRLERG